MPGPKLKKAIDLNGMKVGKTSRLD